MHQLPLPIVFCTLILFSIPNLNAKPIQAGYVQKMVGDSSNYALERQGKKHPLKLLGVVYAGDKIFIEEPLIIDPEVTLSIDGKKIHLENDQSPYTVPMSKGANSIAANLMAMLSKSFTGMHQQYSKTIAMVSRGSNKSNNTPLIFPPLFNSGGDMYATERNLSVRWLGGTAPYRIQLLKGARVVQEMKSDSRRIRMGEQLFLPGNYTIRVEDSSSSKVNISSVFQVIHTPLPTMPKDLADELKASRLSIEMNTTLRTAWLINAHPKLRWEAYQQLCPYKEEYAAKVLCANLLLGE